MKSILSAIAAIFLSLFGVHQAASTTQHLNPPPVAVQTERSASLAAAEVSEFATTSGSISGTPVTSQQPQPRSSPKATSDHTTLSPFVKSAVLSAASNPQTLAAATPASTNGMLATLLTDFAGLLTTMRSQNPNPPSNVQNQLDALQHEIAQTNHINNISNVTLSSPTISAPSITGLSTSQVSEGSNLYYTDARADARINGTSTIGTLLSAPNLTTVGTLASLLATTATSTNFFATNASTTNATSTNLFASLSHFTTGIIDTLTSTAATITNVIATTITGTNATFTNATTTNATSTNLYAGNLSLGTALSLANGGTGGITASAARTNLGLAYASASDVTNGINIAAWGDSLTGAGTPSYPQQLASLSGYSVYNGGVGGNTSTQIAVRMLADTAKHSWPTIIWAGRNNYTDPTTVKADIGSMVGALGSQNYIVLGILNGDYGNEYVGQPDYNILVQLNADLATTYGAHFIDIRSYLVSQYNPAIPQDVIDHGHDVPPSSLRGVGDPLHINTAGAALVAQKIYQNITLLQNPTSVIAPQNLPAVFSAPPIIGEGTMNAGYFSGIGIGSSTPNSLLTISGSTGAPIPLGIWIENKSSGTSRITLSSPVYDGTNPAFIEYDPPTQNALTFNAGFNNINGMRFQTNTGGVAQNRMVILNGGNVGIGTVSPGSKLEVQGLSSAQYFNATSTTNFSTFVGGFVSLASSTVVGQFTTNNASSSLLTVSGTAWFGTATSTTANANTANIGTLNAGTLSLGGLATLSSGFLSQASSTVVGNFTTTGTGLFSGIGIGTTNPQQKLEIENDSANALTFPVKVTNAGNGSSNASAAGILFQTDNPSASVRGKGAFVYAGNYSSWNRGDFMFLQSTTTDAANPTLSNVVMTIKNSGNVGIGTTGPGALLEVFKNVTNSTVQTAEQISGGSGNFGQAGTGVLTTNLGAGDTQVLGSVGGYGNGSQFGLGLWGAANSGAPNVFVQSGGNVGIGTTSPDMLLSVGSATPVGNVAHFENSTGSCYINPTTGVSCSSDSRLKTNINTLTASSGIDALMQLNPVTFNWTAEATGTPTHSGFIAQQVQPILPDLVSQGPDGYYTLNYAGFTPYLVKAVQEIASISGTFEQNLIAWLGNADNGIGDLFANNIYAANDVHAKNELCIGETCVTESQLKAMLASANQSLAGSSSPSSNTKTASTTPNTPPVIQINGNNPAYVNIGDTYNDLGATITGPQPDLNLGIATFDNGTPMNPIQIDTTQAATDTISYVVTDPTGLAATSTRTVIVEAANDNTPTVANDNQATSTTAATSTAQ